MVYEDRYTVKNKFLRAIMGNYTKWQSELNVEYNICGLTHGKGVGSTILTYIVKRAFNIHRLPFYEDRHFTTSSNDAINRYSENKLLLNKVLKCNEFLKNIDDMTKELNEIYLFSQNKLDEIYPNQDYVELSRNVGGGYADILLQLKKNALEKSSEFIIIETDTIDCFTNHPETYSKDVKYTMKIDKKDILYFDKALDIGSEALLERYEYIIMNRDIKGLRKIPVDGIVKNEKFKEFSYITRPIIERSEHCHIRSSANLHVCFDEPKKKPSFDNKQGKLCMLIKKIFGDLSCK